MALIMWLNSRQTGILVFGEDHLMEDTVSSMESNKIAFDKFSGEEVGQGGIVVDCSVLLCNDIL